MTVDYINVGILYNYKEQFNDITEFADQQASEDYWHNSLMSNP